MGLEHRGELRDRGLVILGLDLGADGGEVRRVAGGDVVHGERAGRGNRGPDEQRRKPKRRRFHGCLLFDCSVSQVVMSDVTMSEVAVSDLAMACAHVFMTVSA